MKGVSSFALGLGLLVSACALPPSFPGAQYCGTVDRCQESCRNGDAQACGWTSQAALFGVGMPQSARAAIDYATRGCSGNDGRSCVTLGVVYFKGIGGVERSWPKAAEFNSRACDLGFAIGCNNLGLACRDGHGVEVDVARANVLFAEACDGGAALGCLQLALGTADKMVPEDLAAKALPLLVRDCDPNVNPEVRVCTLAARMYAHGRGSAPDSGRAKALFKKGCDRGDPDACDAAREK